MNREDTAARERARQFPRFGVQADDLPAQGRRLEAAAAAFEEADGGIWIDPDYALGCLLSFREESPDRGWWAHRCGAARYLSVRACERFAPSQGDTPTPSR